MENKEITIKVERDKLSYDFKINPKKSSFENNYKNNSLDWICIREGNKEYARFRCQTVANYCFGDNATADTVDFGDTIAPGEFFVKCFVEPRKFHGQIHGIIRTRDLDGQWINHESMQTTDKGFQNGRWLIHDRYSEKIGKDTNYAWSAGCFILASRDLEVFNKILVSFGVKPGDEIHGFLEEY